MIHEFVVPESFPVMTNEILASLAALALMVIPAKSTARPMVGDLMAEKLYYAEGRQHPGHPLHGSHEGLWAGSER